MWLLLELPLIMSKTSWFSKAPKESESHSCTISRVYLPRSTTGLFFIGFPRGVILDSSSPFLLACHEAEAHALVRVTLRARGFSWMLCFCLMLAREDLFLKSHFSLTSAYRIYIYWSISLHVFFIISSYSLFYFLIRYIPIFFSVTHLQM